MASPLGGDVEEIGNFRRRKIRSHGSIFFCITSWGDNEKIGEFQEREIRSHGSFFWHHLLGAMLRKLAIFKMGKYDHMVPIYFLARRETNHAWLEKIVSRLS